MTVKTKLREIVDRKRAEGRGTELSEVVSRSLNREINPPLGR